MTLTQDHPVDTLRDFAHNHDSLPQTQSHVQSDMQPSSTPVEMNHLSSQRYENTETSIVPSDSQAIHDPPAAHLQAIFSPQTDSPSTSNESSNLAAIIPTSSPNTTDRPAARPRADTEAIGPSSDNPVITADPAAGPAVLITLLLITGARHPYKIDEKYLKKRNVTTVGEEVDPFAISVYTMKELIWRDWREEWEARPTSPSSIRLIHFGKLLDDKNTLKESRFNDVTPNVVHMSIKPQDIVDEEENAKGGKSHGGRNRGDSERTPGCRCVMM